MAGRHKEYHTPYDRSYDGRPHLPQDELDKLRRNFETVEEWVGNGKVLDLFCERDCTLNPKTCKQRKKINTRQSPEDLMKEVKLKCKKRLKGGL